MISPYSLSASVDLLNILLRHAEHIGIAEQEIRSVTGIDPASCGSEKMRIPLQTFHLIWTAVQTRSEDPDFGLHFGENAYRMLRNHLLWALMMSCETVEQAIQKNFQYHNLIMDFIQPVIRFEDDTACLSWEMNHPGMRQERHFSESLLALFYSMIKYATDLPVHLEEVRFTHPAPPDISEHSRIFQAPISFKQPSNEIRLARKTLHTPILLSNPVVLKDLEQVVRKNIHAVYFPDTTAEKVVNLLYKAILQEKSTDIESVCDALAMTTRTLQMKLKAENTTYRQLLDTVRKEISVSCLVRPDASICEIALLLGFSDQSAFQHAFKRWTGKTPGDYRRSRVAR